MSAPNFHNRFPAQYMRMIGPPDDFNSGGRGPLVDGTFFANPPETLSAENGVFAGWLGLGYYIPVTYVQLDLIMNRVRNWSFDGLCRYDAGSPAQAVASFSTQLTSPRSDEVDLQSDYPVQVNDTTGPSDPGVHRGFAQDYYTGDDPNDPDVLVTVTDGDGNESPGTGAIYYRFWEYAFGVDDGDGSINSWRLGPDRDKGGMMSFDLGVYFRDYPVTRTVGHDTTVFSLPAPVVDGDNPSNIAIYGQIGQDTPIVDTVMLIDGTPYPYNFVIRPTYDSDSFWTYGGRFSGTSGL